MRPFPVAILLSIGLIPMGIVEAKPLVGKDASIEYREDGGARVLLAGVPIVRGSSIQLHAPDWKDGYYSSNASPRSIVTDEASRSITIGHAVDAKIKFAATETYRFVADDRVEILLQGQVETALPVQLEWTIGYLNAFALYGGSYADASMPGDDRPVAPQAPAPHDDPAVIANTGMIKLSTRAGSITCSVEGDGVRLTLLDGRLSPQRWWAQDIPSLWLGALNVNITPGEPFELRAVLEFAPAPPSGRRLSHRYLDAAMTPVERAYTPPGQPVRVIPTPSRLELHDGRHVLGRTDGAEQAGDPLVRAIVREKDGSMNPEAYAIRCDERGIQVRSADEAGFRYAMHTLRQLVRTDDDGTIYVPACTIDDAPSLAFRGVHIFPGRDSLDFHRRLIENVIARYKFNHVILECEYTQWDSAQGIWVDFSMPKDQIRAYVQMLRDNGLEPIPLVQSLGHMWWMFRNDQNLDLAEDPEMPRAYDATNPKTYEFIDRIYEEALELFGPIRYFHIGHDEITLFGRYPNRPESKRWGVTKLFLSDIAHWERFFKPRNIRIMMWGDMLLAKEEIKDGAAFGDSLEEARKRREQLSKEIIICDWHYEALKPQDYPSLGLFKEAGFTTIASTWFNPMNIYAFAEAARRNEAWGLLQTTWAGYNVDEGALDRELRQFAAYVLAAEYAWSGDSPAPQELPWRADEVLIRALEAGREPTAPRDGSTLNLPGWMPLRDWLGLGKAADLGSLAAVDRVGGYRFEVGNEAIVLGGSLLPREPRAPGGASIKVSGKAAQLAFLHATAYAADKAEAVGHYEIRYADGSAVRLPLRYGVDIRAWDDPAIARNALAAWAAKNDAGVTGTARVFVWNNPHPQKPIESVMIGTDHPYASPVLFALTAIAGGE